MNPTEQQPNEFISIHIDNGNVSLHRYDDRPDDIILTSLYVKKKRKQGNGTKLLLRAEQIARGLHAKQIFLQAKKHSWQKQWYNRRKYDDYEDNGNFIWMKKVLNDSASEQM
ncbi:MULTISPECIES: GNAT family N-acetyltransferase [Bacteroidales]|uniref:GNAT family N-acetyltransferase n=1 Tax=Bacteroidales TaxID=171549 RepID=UPI00258D1F05|nr:GNAT family N-acetyltransferase [Xylanibacter rodentium]